MKNKLKVCIYGLSHLGCTTSACLADLGFEILGIDNNVEIIEELNCQHKAPIEEKNLNKLILKNITKNLHFTCYIHEEMLKEMDYLWVTFDTPVKGEEKSDVDFILERLDKVMNELSFKIPIIISSQIPVGTMEKIIKKYPKHNFCYCPENLRHGTAIDNFLNPDRIVIGIRKIKDKILFNPLFKIISNNLLWVKIEEAEMIKHAINSFLATCITFANELGEICKENKINYEQVRMGLITESRIGNKLPLKAGKAYTGKTLARDIRYLIDMSGNKFFKIVRRLNNNRLK
jgi:UDPglucose 6-dehydrogenase